jgi:hypothetical protein
VAPHLQVEVDPVEAERLAEPLPQQLGGPAGRRHRDQVDAVGRQLLPPAVEDVGDLLHAPEPAADPGGPRGVLDLLEEPGVGELAAVLDVLLPLGRDLPRQVAHREDDVDLRTVVVAERRERPADLSARRRCQDLVADDGGALVGTHLLRQPVPGADRLRLQPAPRHPHQVEGREEVGVEPVGGVVDAVPGQHPPVAEQHVLEVRRAGLGGADVEQHAPRHPAPLSYFQAYFRAYFQAYFWAYFRAYFRACFRATGSSNSRTARASTPASSGAHPGGPGSVRGTSASGSPCTA